MSDAMGLDECGQFSQRQYFGGQYLIDRGFLRSLALVFQACKVRCVTWTVFSEAFQVCTA